jgi:Silicon transporter
MTALSHNFLHMPSVFSSQNLVVGGGRVILSGCKVVGPTPIMEHEASVEQGSLDANSPAEEGIEPSVLALNDLIHVASDGETLLNPYGWRQPAYSHDDDDQASVNSFEDDRPILPVADVHGGPLHFPDDDKQRHYGKERQQSGTSSRSVLGSSLESIKLSYSAMLLGFSVLCVTAMILDKKTTATSKYHIPPMVACLIFWFSIIWLGVMEGGQSALVGLQSIHPKPRLTLERACALG